jgi:hypothetical protein
VAQMRPRFTCEIWRAALTPLNLKLTARVSEAEAVNQGRAVLMTAWPASPTVLPSIVFRCRRELTGNLPAGPPWHASSRPRCRAHLRYASASRP